MLNKTNRILLWQTYCYDVKRYHDIITAWVSLIIIPSE